MKIKKYPNFSRLKGWCDSQNQTIFFILNQMLHEANTHGNITEIGLYKGKSATILYGLLEKNETITGIDPFPEGFGHLNKSNAITTVKTTIEHFHKNSEKLIWIPKTTEELLNESKVINPTDKIVHVDGDHAFLSVVTDLTYAQQKVKEGGLIIIDDAFNEGWPEVIEAVMEQFADDPFIFPIWIGFNKLVMMKGTRDMASQYHAYLRNAREVLEQNGIIYKESTFFSEKVLIGMKAHPLRKVKKALKSIYQGQSP